MPEINLLLFKLQIFASNNGFFITPILAAVTQYLMTITQPQTPHERQRPARAPASS